MPAEKHYLAFVDSIADSPTVRLDMSGGTRGPFNMRSETRFDPPPLKRSIPSTLLADGGTPTSASYDNRVCLLKLGVMDAGKFRAADPAATAIQLLMREMDRPSNILRYQAGTSAPVFFRTYRSGPDTIDFDPITREVTVSLLAEPFAYGLKEAVSPVTVYNDPVEGATLNLNPFFEVDASDWTVVGGTFVRSTLQSHEGGASGLLTPSGVAATAGASTGKAVVAPSTSYRFSAWVRCAVARNVDLGADWYTSGGAFISSPSPTTVAVAANTWTLLTLNATSAGTAGLADLYVAMTGTPPGSNTLHIDEARFRLPGGNGAMYLDVSSPKGDVETPLNIAITNGTAALGATGRLRSGLAVRRRGTPANVPLFLQAEAMTQGTDTTTQANSASFSGSGNNWSRCTFATATSGQQRVSANPWPSGSSTDYRGTYRVFLRCRQTVASDSIDVQLQYGTSAAIISNDIVRVPGDTNIKYLDLGLVQFPAGYDPVTDSLSGVELAVQGTFLAVYIRRNSGSGNFDMDLLLFMPADDRLEFVKWPELQAFTTDIFVAEGGPRPAAYCLDTTGYIRTTQTIEITGGGMMITPGRTNRLFFCRDLGTGTAATGAGDSITATSVLTASYYPRYLGGFRPAAS